MFEPEFGAFPRPDWSPGSLGYPGLLDRAPQVSTSKKSRRPSEKRKTSRGGSEPQFDYPIGTPNFPGPMVPVTGYRPLLEAKTPEFSLQIPGPRRNPAFRSAASAGSFRMSKRHACRWLCNQKMPKDVRSCLIHQLVSLFLIIKADRCNSIHFQSGGVLFIERSGLRALNVEGSPEN